MARETKKSRLLCLGMPIANRMDAIRVAEEFSMIDVISHGRLEMGFVKGSPYEVGPANSNPSTVGERFCEAHDLILKAMTTHDGPFNWEGEHFHYRQANIWPRPYQQTFLDSFRRFSDRCGPFAHPFSGGVVVVVIVAFITVIVVIFSSPARIPIG